MNELSHAFAANGLDWIVAEAQVETLRAFVTTRSGGTCTGERATLDLGPADQGSLDASVRACVTENRRRVAAFLPAAPIWLHQVHGTTVATVDAANVQALSTRPPAADAAVTRLADVPLAVRIADCLPVVLTDDAAVVVAVAHAGWRGLAAGVIEATVDAMQVAPASVHAWLGPCIGARAFEVGDDVRDAFADRHAEDAAAFRAHRPGKWLADLRALARARLARAGVVHVGGVKACTFEDRERFFSYRRDRTPARFAAFAWRRR